MAKFFRSIPKNLEQEYRKHYLPSDSNCLRTALAVIPLPGILSIYSNYLLLGFSYIFWLTLALTILFIMASLITVGLIGRTTSIKEYDRAVIGFAIFTVITLLYLDYNLLSKFPEYLTLNILVPLVGYLLFPPTTTSKAIILFHSIGELVLYRYFSHPPDVIFNFVFITFLITNLIGLFFSIQMHNHRFQIFNSIKRRTRITEKLRILASTDDLTGVLNRRKLFELAEAEFEIYKSTNQTLSIIMFDLDNFKNLNDQYGHQVGDHILKQFTDFIAKSIRQTDIWGRIGGEEFILILPNTQVEFTQIIGERLRTEISHLKTIIAGECIQFTISIGITIALPSDNSFADVFKRTDEALYKAKNCGRNRVEALLPEKVP
ncbi:MAG: Diguanylate cyclase with sensor [Firmicutes bacterium]|nr:Diguanylate cyclase with sensor [Bacillota bacterium]